MFPLGAFLLDAEGRFMFPFVSFSFLLDHEMT